MHLNMHDSTHAAPLYTSAAVLPTHAARAVRPQWVGLLYVPVLVQVENSRLKDKVSGYPTQTDDGLDPRDGYQAAGSIANSAGIPKPPMPPDKVRSGTCSCLLTPMLCALPTAFRQHLSTSYTVQNSEVLLSARMVRVSPQVAS